MGLAVEAAFALEFLVLITPVTLVWIFSWLTLLDYVAFLAKMESRNSCFLSVLTLWLLIQNLKKLLTKKMILSAPAFLVSILASAQVGRCKGDGDG